MPNLVLNIINDFRLSQPANFADSLPHIFKPGTIIYLVLIGVFAFHKRLPAKWISSSFICALMIVGVQSLLDLGFIGSGMLYLLFACTLATLLFDGWRMLIPGGLSIIAVAWSGWLWQTGQKVFYFDPADYATSINTYIIRLVTVLFFLTILIASIHRMVKYLTDLIRRQNHDITERKRAEEALRESEEKLSALFASMTEMVVLHELVFDEDDKPVNYRITDCNTAYTKITGICRADAVGKLANEVFGTLEPLSLDVFTRVGVSGEPYHYETYFAPLNKYFAISVVSPGKNRFATITTDITERRAAEAEVRPLNEELEERVAKRTAELEQSVELLRATQAELVESEKMAALSHLVVGVAHELNTPIGTSLTASSYLDQQVEQLERQIAAGTLTHNQFTDATQTLRKAATLNQTSLQRAARLVGFFKEMAVSMEAEAPVPIGLRALVDSAFHNLTRQRTTGLPHLENHIAPALTVITRTVPLSRVLAKILENATDHAFEGRAPGTVTVSAITNDGWVELHVCDDGSGIPENDWKKVFEPFYTTKRGAGHVGLGLSIAFNLVIHLLGGTIQCQSGSDGGACFNIRFPTD